MSSNGGRKCEIISDAASASSDDDDSVIGVKEYNTPSKRTHAEFTRQQDTFGKSLKTPEFEPFSDKLKFRSLPSMEKAHNPFQRLRLLGPSDDIVRARNVRDALINSDISLREQTKPILSIRQKHETDADDYGGIMGFGKEPNSGHNFKSIFTDFSKRTNLCLNKNPLFSTLSQLSSLAKDERRPSLSPLLSQR